MRHTGVFAVEKILGIPHPVSVPDISKRAGSTIAEITRGSTAYWRNSPSASTGLKYTPLYDPS
eukprot:3085004-Rhodomonas_salina.1